MNENIVIKTSKWTEQDIKTLFGEEDVSFVQADDIPDLLVKLGIFKSKSQARRANRIGDIPTGFTDGFKASKKHRLWIWNPS